VWLIWTTYWAVKLYASLFLLELIPDLFSKMYLSTTLYTTFLFVGLTVRTLAAILAIIAVVKYSRGGWNLGIAKMVGAVIVMEAIYLISNIPQAWVGPAVNDFVLIPETTIPALVDALLVPIPLIILAIRLKWPGKIGSAIRWACVAGVIYIMALWVRLTGQWIGTFIQTEKYTTYFGGFPAHGIDYLLNYPLNMLSFILTVIGLPLLAIYLLKISLPAIRNTGARPDIRKIGLVVTLLGAYFMIALFMLYALPDFVGGKAIWSSFFTGHNVDLWIFALPMVGIPLMLRSEDKIERTEQTQ
jgi:hypothetical protein